jgi:hypothetical protein
MAINVPIISNWDGKGVRDAESSLGRFSRAATGIAKSVAASVAAIGAGAVAGAVSAIKAASDIGEATSKVGVLFGDAADEVVAFSKTAATEFGLSRQAVLDAAGTFGTFGKAAGLSGSDLATFSTDFAGLAADIASFSNTSPEQAITAIGAALRGESEPIRQYGVLLDDARLKARALELGIYDGEGALNAQQKILAAQAEIYAQTGDAQGDFSRTSDGLAGQSKILRAQLSNVVLTIGERLLPIALELAEFVSERVIPVIEQFADTFGRDGLGGVIRLAVDYLKDLGPKALKAVTGAIGALADWIVSTGWPLFRDAMGRLGAALVDWIRPRIRPALAQLLEIVKAIGNWVVDVGLPWLAEKLVEWGNAFVDWIRPQIRPALERLGELLVELGNWLLDVAVPKLIELAKKLGPPLWEWIKAVTPELLRGLGELLLKLGKWVITDGIPKLLKLGKDLAGALLSGLWTVLKDLGSGAAGLAAQIVNGLIGFINRNVIRKINDLLEFTVFGVTVNPPDIPDIPTIAGATTGGAAGIPRLAAGAIVTAPTLALVGEGTEPEAVIPLSKLDAFVNAGGGTTVNVYGALDPVGVARQIRRLLDDDARRNGRTAFI